MIAATAGSSSNNNLKQTKQNAPMRKYLVTRKRIYFGAVLLADAMVPIGD